MVQVFDQRSLSSPTDMAKFQRVFDAACRLRRADPESTEARAIALNIMALHNAGMSDEALLRAAVSCPRRLDSTD